MWTGELQIGFQWSYCSKLYYSMILASSSWNKFDHLMAELLVSCRFLWQICLELFSGCEVNFTKLGALEVDTDSDPCFQHLCAHSKVIRLDRTYLLPWIPKTMIWWMLVRKHVFSRSWKAMMKSWLEWTDECVNIIKTGFLLLTNFV